MTTMKNFPESADKIRQAAVRRLNQIKMSGSGAPVKAAAAASRAANRTTDPSGGPRPPSSSPPPPPPPPAAAVAAAAVAAAGGTSADATGPRGRELTAAAGSAPMAASPAGVDRLVSLVVALEATQRRLVHNVEFVMRNIGNDSVQFGLLDNTEEGETLTGETEATGRGVTRIPARLGDGEGGRVAPAGGGSGSFPSITASNTMRRGAAGASDPARTVGFAPPKGREE